MNLATATRQPSVALTYEEAAEVANVLRAYASSQSRAARRAKSPLVRQMAEGYATHAFLLEDLVVRRMFAQAADQQAAPEAPAEAYASRVWAVETVAEIQARTDLDAQGAQRLRDRQIERRRAAGLTPTL